MNILACPTHYYFTDKFGSELYWSYKLVSCLDKEGVKYYSIVWSDKYSTKYNLLNSKIIYASIDKADKLSSNEFSFGLKTPLFIYRYFNISKSILKFNNIDIIHHILPFGYDRTFNPLPLLGYTQDIPFVIGPVNELPTIPNNVKLDYLFDKNVKSIVSQNILKMISPILSTFSRYTLKKCDKLIAVNNYGKNLYGKYIDKDKIEVIPQGIDLNLFYYDKYEYDDSEEIVLLTVAPLVKLKGIEYLIKSFKNVIKFYPNILLRIVGNGPELLPLKFLAKSLKIYENIIFEGFVPHSRLSEIYKQCDIFILPSIYGGSNAILEAMASAKPVITSDTIGLNEIVIHNKTGYLVPPTDIEALTSATIRLIENKKLRRQMGLNGRFKVEQEHNWDIITKKYYNLYDRLI